MKKKLLGILILCIVVVLPVSAGDIAEFVNLGFSENGRYFLFGQYGYQADEMVTYADLYFVDVAGNCFVEDGVHHGQYGSVLEPGQEPNGGLFTLFSQVYSLKDRYGIKPLRKGRPLYYRLEGNTDGVNLSFRDFETGTKYAVALNQSVIGEDGKASSSFYIDVVITDKNGREGSYQVGLPEYRRKGVKEYTIEKILLAPDGNSLVFVIAKTIYDGESPDIRYMVETLKP